MIIYEYQYISKEEGKETLIRFQWISGIELIKRNMEEMVTAGRGRWKIEIEGFNNQKNGLYRIEHINVDNLLKIMNQSGYISTDKKSFSVVR